MKLFEFVTGSKKICRGCHKAFSVEPLTCPNCGTKVKTHKAEKWGAVIGAFVGSFLGCRKACETLKFLLENPDFYKKLLAKAFDMTLEQSAYAPVGYFVVGGIFGCLAGFVIMLVIKKIVMTVQAKKTRQEV